MKPIKMNPDAAIAFCARSVYTDRRGSSVVLDESVPRIPGGLRQPLFITLQNFTRQPPDIAALRDVIQPLGNLGIIDHFRIGYSSMFASTVPLAWVPNVPAVVISSEAVRKYDEISGLRKLRSLEIDQRTRKVPPVFLAESTLSGLELRVTTMGDLPCINACGKRLSSLLLRGRRLVDLTALGDVHPQSLEFRQAGIRTLAGVGLSRLVRLHACFCPYLSGIANLGDCRELLLMACRSIEWDSIRSAVGMEGLEVLSHPVPIPGFGFIRGSSAIEINFRRPCTDCRLQHCSFRRAPSLKSVFLLRASRRMLKAIAEARPDIRVGGAGEPGWTVRR